MYKSWIACRLDLPMVRYRWLLLVAWFCQMACCLWRSLLCQIKDPERIKPLTILAYLSEICWVMTNCWLILLVTLRLVSFLLKGYVFFINRCSEINLESWKTVFVFSCYIIYENTSQQICLVNTSANEHVQAVKIVQKFDLIWVAIWVYYMMYSVVMKNILEQSDVRTRMSLWNERSLDLLVFCCIFLWNYFRFWQE